MIEINRGGGGAQPQRHRVGEGGDFRGVHHFLERAIEDPVEVEKWPVQQGLDDGEALGLLDHPAASLGEVLLQKLLDGGAYPHHGRQHDDDEARRVLAAELMHEGAGLGCGRTDQRPDQVEFGCVLTGEFGGPRGGVAAGRVPPHRRRCLVGQARYAVLAGCGNGGAQRVQHVVAGLFGRHPEPLRALMVADGDDPPPL